MTTITCDRCRKELTEKKDVGKEIQAYYYYSRYAHLCLECYIAFLRWIGKEIEAEELEALEQKIKA